MSQEQQKSFSKGRLRAAVGLAHSNDSRVPGIPEWVEFLVLALRIFSSERIGLVCEDKGGAGVNRTGWFI